jgi:uracil-DNA glycosylase
LVFVLWGAHAQEKQRLIHSPQHTVITSPHPSPLSAHRGFFGSRPFTAVNSALSAHGVAGIDWRLPIHPNRA